ncbi:hypothetical protein [Streptomyces sp. PTD5-9]|uniref:hypothetical protein n=1 Tax=Streptomyces sp. PTD5-9 TaxID=3120150 RepID=UPI00300983C0
MVSTDERVGTPDEDEAAADPRPHRTDPEAASGTDTGADPEAVPGEEAGADDAAPAETGTAEAGTAEAGDGAGDARPVGRRFRTGAVVLLVVALVAAGAGFLIRAQQLRDTPATDNLALTDTASTARVTGDVSSALGKVFSYGPGSTGATKESAGRLLGGKALQQYAALFGQVEKQAEDQRLTLTTHVVRTGVTRLSATSAHLLVFLDQVYERRGKPATTATAQLSVTAELRGGHWQIVDIVSR